MQLRTNSRNWLAIAGGVMIAVAGLASCPWLLTNIWAHNYLPHGFCFLWDPRLVWLHVVSDSIIWISYTAIASTLALTMYSNRRQLKFQLVFLLFGTFIVACGFTHLLEVVVLWKPLYWLAGDIKLLTAGASLVTALLLPFMVPQLKPTLAKAALSAENERRFVAAINSSLDSFFILESVRDLSGKIIDFRFRFMNELAAQLVGRRPEETVGLGICEVFPGNRTAGLLDRYKEVVSTGKPFVDEVALDFGNAPWLKLQVSKLEDGVAITASDITERKRREEIKRASDRRFLAVTESSLDSVYLLESVRNAAGEIVDFRILFVNDRAASLVSLLPGAMVGQMLCELISGNRSSGLFHSYLQVTETGIPYEHEFPALGFDGVVTAAWLKLQVVKLDDGVVVTASDISERKQRELTLAASEHRFVAAMESSLDSFYILESVREAGEIIDFRFTFANGVGGRMMSRPLDGIIGHQLCELVPEHRHDGMFLRYKQVVETGLPLSDELLLNLKDIDVSWTKIQVVKLDDGIAVTASDISDRKRLEREETRAFTESLIFSSPAAVIITDPDYLIRAINPAAEKMLWYKSEELVGRQTPLIFYLASEVQERAKRLSQTFRMTISPEQAIFASDQMASSDPEGEWTFVRKHGPELTVQVTVTPLRSEYGQPTGFMITAYDVSERKRREEYISHLAQHDVLTSLPTRQLLLDRLSMVLSRSERFVTRCALLMIDLNNFKQVNDTHGHHAGDKVLVEVAQRLRAALRAMDTVARMGGDEFVVLVSDLETEADALRVGDKLLAVFDSPFVVNEQISLRVKASIGICVYPDGGADGAALLRNADAAMYQAKSEEKNGLLLFSGEIAKLAQQKLELETALTGALDNNEFLLHYQPQISVADGTMIGVEALLRWKNEKLGTIPPLRFIPLVEKSGLIVPIGAWVIQTACRDLRKLQDHFGRELLMAVNISARQLEQPDLLQVVEQALASNGLDPRSLEVEITESMLMSDSPNASQFFAGLRRLGVRVAIDDFGTGFSSMSYLLRFSVDRLKVDRCFIQDCSTNETSATVTNAIITLAHQLNASVVAEGVENQEQMDFLKSVDCDDVQGYYFSRPVALELIQAPTAALK